jgi:cob(I)alamin adenosyltransferase
MDLQILCSKALSRIGVSATASGDLDRAERWASVAADNLRSMYATVIQQYWNRLSSSEILAAIIEKTEAKAKAALYQKKEGC